MPDSAYKYIPKALHHTMDSENHVPRSDHMHIDSPYSEIILKPPLHNLPPKML